MTLGGAHWITVEVRLAAMRLPLRRSMVSSMPITNALGRSECGEQVD